MKVSIVIPNYNGVKLLRKNLPKVLEVAKNCEVIVVDDASTDESVEEVKSLSRAKSRDQKLKIIRNEKNLGFAATVNRGVEEASGDFIVLLNSDIVPEVDFLPPLIKHFSDPKVFAVGCLQKCQEGKQIIFRGRGIGKFERGFLIHSRGAVSDKDTSCRRPPVGGLWQRTAEVRSLSRAKSRETPRMVEESKKTLWVFGGAGIFRKKIWERLGGLNPLYNPFYWEDVDLSYRALKAGYSLLFEPKSIVAHHQEEGAIRKTYCLSSIRTIAYRNQILFVWLNITDIFFLLQHIFFIPYYLVKAIFTLDFAFLRGFFLVLAKLPEALDQRKKNMKLWKISDQDILKRYTI